VDRNLMIVLILLGLFVLCSRANVVKEILSRNKWLCLLCVYIFLSVIWSNFPAISLRRSFRSVGTLVVVLIVLTERDPREAMSVLLRRLYLIIIPLSIVAIKYFRNIGVGYTWDGVEEMWVGLTKDKNNLGQVAVCSGLLCTWQILRSRPNKKLTLDLLLLIGTLWLLRGSETSHSSTAIVGYFIGVVVLIGLQLVKRRAALAKRVIQRATLAFLVLAPAVYMVLDQLDFSPTKVLLETTGRDATLSDRTFLWKDLLDNVAKSPILGVGFGAFWVGPSGYSLYPLPNWSKVTHTWRPGQGHNGFIDVCVDLGVVGLALLLPVIRSAVAGALDDLQYDFEFGRLRLTLLLTVLVNNLTESSLLDGTHSFWFLFLLAGVNIPRRYAVRLQSVTELRDRSTQHAFHGRAARSIGASGYRA
jgi:O-antigen ligase